MPDIGSQLEQARLALNLTYQQIEADTKISPRYLKALEENDFSSLPGTAYAVGFLRIYAKHLGLDSDALVQAFKEVNQPQEPIEIKEETEEESNDTLAKINRTPWKKWRVGMLASLLLIVFTVGFLYYLGSQPGEQEPPPPPPVDEIPWEPAEPSPPDGEEPSVQEPEEPEEPVFEILEIEIVAVHGSCWLRAEGSQETRDYSLSRGDRILIQDESHVTIRFGSAGAVEITVNGILQEPLGAVGAVVEQEYSI